MRNATVTKGGDDHSPLCCEPVQGGSCFGTLIQRKLTDNTRGEAGWTLLSSQG